MKRFSMLCLLLALLGVSCERHEFDGPNGTRKLHEHHDAHGDGGHGHDGHAKDAAH